MNSIVDMLKWEEVLRETMNSLIQNIGILVNQHKTVIEESNRYLNDIDDFMR